MHRLLIAKFQEAAVCAGRMIGLRADRDADGDAGRDSNRRSDRRDDSSYRTRRDDTRRRDDDRSYSRRDRSPRRDSYRDQHDDRHRQDDNRGDRARPHESKGGKGVEELDAEMDDLKEQVCHTSYAEFAVEH